MTRLAANSQLSVLPVTPGEWLRCFRHRLRDEDGRACTPGRLGLELGVSERTVRRWEKGLSQPSADDLRHLGACLKLTGCQSLFLQRAFTNLSSGRAPPLERFRGQAQVILTTGHPAVLLDNLFYVRVWNSYASALRVVGEAGGESVHILERLLEPASGFRWDDGYISRLLQTIWMETAFHCGSSGFARMVHQLDAIPGFRERWAGLAIDSGPYRPLGAPEEVALAGSGRFRVFSCRVHFPPFYHLWEYIPVDSAAETSVAGMHDATLPGVQFHPSCHWSLDGQPPEVTAGKARQLSA